MKTQPVSSTRQSAASFSSLRAALAKTVVLAAILAAFGAASQKADDSGGPVTIQAGTDWLPLDLSLDIEPGSALDFTNVVPWHAPAGKFGRVIAGPQGKTAFAGRPNDPVRFYGCNFCFSGQYLSHEQADRVATRLQRLGYNAVRFHHYESLLVARSQGNSTALKPDARDQLDYLFAALKQRGIYVTTDLFVSRPVFAGEVWPGATGDVGMDNFKKAVLVNDRAFDNFKAFTRELLGHVNPYTKTRWAEDPTLAWLCCVNEGNPGNRWEDLAGPLKDDWSRAWNRWLAARYPTREDLARALGALEAGQDPASGTVPLPSKFDNSPASIQRAIFFAETEIGFHDRTRKFLRDELGCQALLTDMNAWTNPIQYQAVRGGLDYVDDHFYVDHPQFLERPWRLPSRCPNTSPVADGAPGGRRCSFIRLLDRPFTCSEFNYSGPGRFRGVGGILTGALGAVQDWSVIWRFAYSHNRESVLEPRPAGYFDLASDPLSQAAERAAICLFRRGDMSAATHAVAIALTADDVLKNPKSARPFVPAWDWLALVTRVGTLLAKNPNDLAGADLALPLTGSQVARADAAKVLAVDPYASDAGEKILAELRKRGWLDARNSTDVKAKRFQSETGELTVDGPADVLTLDTPRTAGGYAPAGKKIETKAVTVAIEDTDATVWVSSLDNAPIAESRRLLVTHLTDLQNSGVQYRDTARRVLLAWGGLPHLVRSGRATVTVRMNDPARARVWSLASSGKRLAEVKARVAGGALVIPLDVNAGGKARMLYEVEVAR